MLAEDRRAYILKLLENRSSVTVAELSAAFGLSEVSVRWLLVILMEMFQRQVRGRKTTL